MPPDDDNQPDEPQEEIKYLNNKDQWPEGLWEEWGDPPPDEKRCQYVMPYQPDPEQCGLPRYAHDEDGNPVCIFHYEGERNWSDLRRELETAVARGADLIWAKLQNARLMEADLQNADLRCADLREVDLRYANLQKAHLGDADVGNAMLLAAELQDADLMGANLQNANLEGAKLQNADVRWADLQNAYLAWTTLTGEVDLNSADLRGAYLAYVQLSPESKLGNVKWTEDDLGRIRDEVEAKTADDYAACEAVYRQIKQSYQESGDYQRAGDFFIREMECQRAQLYRQARIPPAWTREYWKSLLQAISRRRQEHRQTRAAVRQAHRPEQRRRGSPSHATKGAGAGETFVEIDPFEWWEELKPREPREPLWVRFWDAVWPKHGFERAFRWLMCATCRYGEEPKRLLGIMGGLVVTFAVVHMLAGFKQVQGGESAPVFMGWLSYNEKFGFVEAVWKAVYFSVVNFTSLGHGDLQPTDAGSVVCSIEVALGVTLIALFMVCVARRFSR